MAVLSDLIGKTLKSVENLGDELRFDTEDGRSFALVHHQDCCECVRIEDVVGDLSDLVGSPITLADESSGETPSGYKFEHEPDSYTWTFYKFATFKGYVDVRWLGQSNGYYGEGVDFVELG